MITEAELRNATWSFKMHGRLARGGSIYVYQCDEHPGLTIEKWRKDRHTATVHRYFYDGTEVAGLAEAAELLNRKAETQKDPTAEAMGPVLRGLTRGVHDEPPGREG